MKKLIDSENTKKNILIVEDTIIIADCLADMLGAYGEISIAQNGREALEMVMAAGFDAVLSDVHMPEMDGIEFYKRAVEHDPGIKERFMFFTSSVESEHLNFFIDNDVPFLFKPAHLGEIVSLISKILERPNEELAVLKPEI
jgi:two-component system NtrC family sensor kinase